LTNINKLVYQHKSGEIAVLTIDNAPVNALSQKVRQGLMDGIVEANRDSQIKAIVICCAGRTFIAGADISEFGKPPLEPHLPDVLNAIEQSTKPVVAALHGTTLGGGFELALACHYRIALSGSRLGLPEVTLGLIPGAGGTQRLPRRVGLEKALQMITSGKPVTVESMLSVTETEKPLIDAIVEQDLLASAIEFAEKIVDKPFIRASVLPLARIENHQQIFAQWRSQLAKKSPGQIAPQKAIQAIESSLQMPFPQALKKERELFIECRNSPQSAAMRHAFFAERQASKIENIDSSIKPQAIERVAVIGAGTMGCGIASCFASAGFDVCLLEIKPENLQAGLRVIRNRYQQSVDRGRIDQATMDVCINRIHGTCDYADLAEVDLVVEAAFESMQVKKAIFAELEKHCKPQAILATNTSYLDIDEMALSTQRPGNIIGMHFFSPADVMKLLEVVRATKTDSQTLVTVVAVGKRIGKIAVAVGVCYGFVGNRMYSAYGAAANALLLEGATPDQVDNAMQDWGMAMGPFAVADLSGIDIGYKARRERPGAAQPEDYFRPADLMVEKGRLGRKSGVGFYSYRDGKRQPDPAAVKLIRHEAQRLGITQRKISDLEIQQRLTESLAKEGESILADGIVSRAGDLDAIWLNGYGFPRFRGGPMCYADEMGLVNGGRTVRR